MTVSQVPERRQLNYLNRVKDLELIETLINLQKQGIADKTELQKFVHGTYPDTPGKRTGPQSLPRNDTTLDPS